MVFLFLKINYKNIFTLKSLFRAYKRCRQSTITSNLPFHLVVVIVVVYHSFKPSTYNTLADFLSKHLSIPLTTFAQRENKQKNFIRFTSTLKYHLLFTSYYDLSTNFSMHREIREKNFALNTSFCKQLFAKCGPL